MIEYRFAVRGDKAGILNCIRKSFGYRGVMERMEDFSNVVIAVEDGEIVGVSGLTTNDKLIPGYELGYTCVNPEWRHKGVCTQLVLMVIDKCKELGIKKLYWSAWRTKDKDRPNPYSVLTHMGFKKACSPYLTWSLDFNCDLGVSTCVECTGQGCTCYEDLWYLNITPDL